MGFGGFGGIVGGASSDTQAPVTTSTNSTGAGENIQGGSGNISADYEQAQNLNNYNEQNGIPVADFAGLIDHTLGTLTSGITATGQIITNAGQQGQQAAANASGSQNQQELLYIAIGAAVLIAALILLRK